MSEWTCPHCGQTVHGIGNALDRQLAIDLHASCTSEIDA